MRAVLLCLAAAGCGFHPTVAGTQGDDSGGVMPDAACHSTCQDAQTLVDCASGTATTCPLGCVTDATAGDRCALPTPSNGASLSDLGTHDLVIDQDATLETTTGGIVTATGAVLRVAFVGTSPEGWRYDQLGLDRGVLGVRSLVIASGATLHVTGPRVLIVLAANDITIDGTLDASAGQIACTAATLTQCGGPGGGIGGAADTDGTGCSPGKAGFDGSGDETGGGGGGYGVPGGAAGGTSVNPGGAGGNGNCSVTGLDPIAAGSGGGGGGAGGAGGGGGGAVQLTALGNLKIQSTGGVRASVRANGAGGKAGPNGAGGGGGGSAGGILLEGQIVIVDNAILVANAGGGGAGDNGGDGNPGRLDTSPAAGGTGGRPGGQGAARGGTPVAGTGGGDGTGGGGGSVGRIFINSGAGQYMPINGTVISPIEHFATAKPM